MFKAFFSRFVVSLYISVFRTPYSTALHQEYYHHSSFSELSLLFVFILIYSFSFFFVSETQLSWGVKQKKEENKIFCMTK